MNSWLPKLSRIYQPTQAKWLADQLTKIISSSTQPKEPLPHLNQSHVALISYANTIESDNKEISPLLALNDFLKRYKINQALPILHLLPFYPWDTDRGFSVKDHRQVHHEYGTWEDVAKLSHSVKLMFDFVVNHASINNSLVQGALIERHLDHGDPRYKKVGLYKDFVIAYSDSNKPVTKQLSRLSRPRPHPVLTRYTVIETKNKALLALLGQAPPGHKKIGQGWVWTTFSPRQVDINFANPRVLLEIIKILLHYTKHKASLIRLDAIAYVWKNLQKTSIHEPEVHTLLQIIDDVLAATAPHVLIVTEVNEAQEKVLPYLGTPTNPESDLVYQFAHFALAVHAVTFGDATYYRQWLPTTNDFQGRQFTTVLGSHDGMGLRPLRGILPEHEINRLAELLIKKHHALPNYAHLPGGQPIIYEVCATPWHLINEPGNNQPFSIQLKRYQTVLALGLIPRGLPATYINGLLGVGNYLPPEGLDENRTINREIFDYQELCDQLDQPNSRQRQIMDAVIHLLKKRAAEPSFAPDAKPIQVLDPNNNAIIAVRLEAKDQLASITTLVNISDQAQKIELKKQPETLRDVLSDQAFKAPDGELTLKLEPYQVLWLKATSH